MLRIAVCDDDRILCEQLEEFLLRAGKSQNAIFDIDIFCCGETLFHAMDIGEKYDVIFLDIELVSMTGIEIGHIIREERNNNETQIVYISSNDSYALELFKVRPLDFLVKPLRYEAVENTLLIALRLLKSGNRYFEFSKQRHVSRVPVANILYFESSKKKIIIITKEEAHEFYGRMDDIIKKLPPSDFIEIHNSYLINYNYVAEYCYDYVVMTNKTQLPVSQNHRKSVRHWLLKRKRSVKND